MRWIDPPSGSSYGFPKPFDPTPGRRSKTGWWRMDSARRDRQVAG